MCKVCWKKKCEGCNEKCFCDFDGLNFFNDGLIEYDLKLFVNFFKGVFGEICEYCKEYVMFCR